jgi:hypothetical protein
MRAPARLHHGESRLQTFGRANITQHDPIVGRSARSRALSARVGEHRVFDSEHEVHSSRRAHQARDAGVGVVRPSSASSIRLLLVQAVLAPWSTRPAASVDGAGEIVKAAGADERSQEVDEHRAVPLRFQTERARWKKSQSLHLAAPSP